MNASIPGRYGFRRKSEQRSAALARAWTEVHELVEQQLCVESPEMEPLPWDTFPEGLDPAAGELDPQRATRKRAQVQSLAAFALEMIKPGTKAVEFGAGTGHLGLLLAHLRPDASVVLVEARAGSITVARSRIETMRIRNCEAFHGTVDDFANTAQEFDLALGLHTCGLLADAVLALAVKRRSSVCLVPCCYGQVASLKVDHQRGEGTAQRMHPCSQAMQGATSSETFAWCAKAADFTPGKGGAFDVESIGFQTALRCMRIIDTDRLLLAREDGYYGELGILSLGSSPKCSVIRLRPSRQNEVKHQAMHNRVSNKHWLP